MHYDILSEDSASPGAIAFRVRTRKQALIELQSGKYAGIVKCHYSVAHCMRNAEFTLRMRNDMGTAR